MEQVPAYPVHLNVVRVISIVLFVPHVVADIYCLILTAFQ
jgi:hypothetical protein